MTRSRWMATAARRLALAVLLLVAPVPAGGQAPSKVPRIGLLSPFSASDTKAWHQAFRQGLRELGWVDGQNIAFEYRYAEGRIDRLGAHAADLVRLKVDLIFVDTTSPALAAKKATSTIPIVMAAASEAVASGLVASLAQPGGNVTGLDQIAPGLVGKRLDHKWVAWLLSPSVTNLGSSTIAGSSRVRPKSSSSTVTGFAERDTVRRMLARAFRRSHSKRTRKVYGRLSSEQGRNTGPGRSRGRPPSSATASERDG